MIQSIHFTSIIREGRVRKDYSGVPSLAESLYHKGFIHPVCINHESELIAGGRRSAAIEYLLANGDKFPPSAAHPTMQMLLATGVMQYGVHFTHRTTSTIDELAELELIENIERQQFTWQEEVLAVRKIHALKRRAVALGQIEDCEVWGQKQTGRLLNMSQANVSYCLTLAEKLDDVDSPLWKCGSITEAIQTLVTARMDEANKRLADEVKSRASTMPVITQIKVESIDSLVAGFAASHNPSLYQSGSHVAPDLSEFGVVPLPASSSSTVASPTSPSQPTVSVPDNDQINEAAQVVTKFILHKPIEEMGEVLGKAAVDHIICDPPYAIDMEFLSQSNQGMKDIDRIADTHQVEQNLSDFEVWMKTCFDVVKPRGFVIWFCDGFHFRLLYDLAEKIGFKACRWPFHWVKTTPCMNQAAAFNFTKAVEHAIILRKDSDSRLVSAQATNYWMGGLGMEDRAALPNHPFIKPLGLWQHLAKAVALPGASIWDPFSGVGSSTRSFLLGGWQPVASEKDENHYASQVHNIMNVYHTLKK